MEKKGWPMCPYVNFEEGSPEKGWSQFYDPPRYSSGYAALFGTISFIPETHMLKPFKERVLSTYALMQTMIEQASAHAEEIIQKRKQHLQSILQQKELAISWKTDSSKYDNIIFKGYEAAQKTSEVTGLPRLYYDHSRPFEKQVNYYDYFSADKFVKTPKAYIIPQGWHEVTDRLAMNGVQMRRLTRDTAIEVEVYHIAEYKASPRAYEKHHRNTDTKLSVATQSEKFLKGDYLVPVDQPAKRFIVEMLEPEGGDAYFSWNFFDAILQQKEGYSDYRWEDVAASYLKEHPEIKEMLEEKKKAEPKFAGDAAAQLNFVYKHSPYYEPAHLKYPVYRIL
jgi:hypothetical protein